MGYSYLNDDLISSLYVFISSVLYFVIVITVLQIVGMWKLYTKAGEKGWKSIIPIYNLVILFKISGLSPWLIFGYFASLIPFIGWVVPIALNAYLVYKLATSFGKDIGWAIGLYFLPTIFYMILAFGNSKYVGPGGNQDSVPEEVVSDEKPENNE